MNGRGIGAELAFWDGFGCVGEDARISVLRCLESEPITLVNRIRMQWRFSMCVSCSCFCSSHYSDTGKTGLEWNAHDSRVVALKIIILRAFSGDQ